MNKLTKRQNEVLELIQDFIHTTGFPPTRADIAQHFGFHSLNAAEEHLRTLERKEYIKILPGTSRGIRIIRGNRIPIIGKVAAGSPVLSENHIQGKANIYPRIGTTMEWDIAAGDAILRNAGGTIKTLDGKIMKYGKRNYKNKSFIARS